MKKNLNFQDFSYNFISSPIESIYGVWQFERPPGWTHRCLSTPDHLFHLVFEGSYHLQINDREYYIKPGNVIYYHASEQLNWIENQEKVRFISISFKAPTLSPLPFQSRVFAASSSVKKQFKIIHTLSSKIDKQFALFSALAQLIDFFEVQGLYSHRDKIQQDGLWWEIESLLKQENNLRPTLDGICANHKISKSSLSRICKNTTGLSPIKRIKKIRMQEAKGLLLFSPLTVSKVAEHLNYNRIHEFSREFTDYFGLSPKAFRELEKNNQYT